MAINFAALVGATKAAEALVQKRESNPLAYYVPNQPQMDSIQALSQEIDTSAMFCANRVGKSYDGCAIVSAVVREYREGVFSLLPRWKQPKNIWICGNTDNLNNNVIPKLQYWLGDAEYKSSKDGKQNLSAASFKFANGFIITIKTYQQDPEVFESADVGLIWFDEPPPELIYRASLSRKFQGCITLIRATPLSGAGYMQETILEPARAGEGWCREAAMFENSFIESDADKKAYNELKDKFDTDKYRDSFNEAFSKVGHWTKDELLALYGDKFDQVEYLVGKRKGRIPLSEMQKTINKLKDDEIEARVFGKFTHNSGVVLKNYDPKKSIIKPFWITNNYKEYEYVMALDPHDRRASFVSWWAIDKFGKKYCYDEYPRRYDEICDGQRYHEIKNVSISYKETVRRMIEQEKEHGFHSSSLIKRRIDPQFQGQLLQKASPDLGTVKDAFERESEKQGWPMYFDLANKNFDFGIKQLKAWLSPDNYGDPDLFIFQNCHHMNYAFANWKFKEFVGKSAEQNYMAEDVQEIHKDPIDTARYALVAVDKKQEDKPYTQKEIDALAL